VSLTVYVVPRTATTSSAATTDRRRRCDVLGRRHLELGVRSYSKNAHKGLGKWLRGIILESFIQQEEDHSGVYDVIIILIMMIIIIPMSWFSWPFRQILTHHQLRPP
jgi:hypothetical protein